jgi:hypothetical protein
MKPLHYILSYFLLGCISFSIIPAETFHHHETDAIVCGQEETHLEEPFFSCELGEFFIPKHKHQHFAFYFKQAAIGFQYLPVVQPVAYKKATILPFKRGPPELA